MKALKMRHHVRDIPNFRLYIKLYRIFFQIEEISETNVTDNQVHFVYNEINIRLKLETYVPSET
jgi:hypothetical protein